MNNYFNLNEELNKNVEPQPDIAICSICGWKGSINLCHIDEEGDFETGYYLIHLCPVCEDGGCIDNYEYSLKAAQEYDKWRKLNH